MTAFPIRPFTVAVLALALQSAAAQQPASAPAVSAGWARPAVQGQAGGGGFLTITGGSVPDRLLGASAPVSKTVELHRMEMDGTVMRMRPVDAIDVPAGAVVELKPGGLHVMFIGMTQTLKKGDTVPLTLRFEKAGEVRTTLQIRVDGPAADGGKADPHAGHHKH